MEKLSFGIPYTLKVNQVYALPAAQRVRLLCNIPGTVMQASNYPNFSASINLAHGGGYQFVSAAPFIRVTNADTLVVPEKTL